MKAHIGRSLFYLLTISFDLAVELLERLDCVCTSASYSLDALNSSLCSRNSSNIEYTLADSALSDVAVVLKALLVIGSVDDDIYLAVGDSVKNIGSALLELADLFSLDAVLGEQIICSACSDYLEAESLKILCNAYYFWLVIVVYADKNSALQRNSCLSSLLSLVICLAEIVGHSQNFTCGTHLGAKERIDLREHIEGEYGFLYTVMLELLFTKLGHG